MNSSARGALLLAVAALLAFLVLRGVEDNNQVPLTSSTIFAPTPTVGADVTLDDAVVVTQPTVVIDPSTARPNNEVSVLVANGTNVPNQASRLTSTLRNQGFLTGEPKNADPQDASTIFYRTGFDAEAVVVQGLLAGNTNIAPMPVPDPPIGTGIDLAPIDVLVLVGDDELAG